MKVSARSSRRDCPVLSTRSRPSDRHQAGILFAVYAPFGGDARLARYPDNLPKSILQHPMLGHLKAVARQGVHVAALIDLVDSDSWLVEIPAWRPDQMQVVSAWKQAMSRPQALSGFLRRAHARFPCAQLVLSLEGHGAGYLPEIDTARITPSTTTSGGGGTFEWRVNASTVEISQTSGPPLLGVTGLVELPIDSPAGAPIDLPMSTWALAQALATARKAGVPKPLVIHFNNCFNMALEHLHAIAPHAEVATGYANYNFFTAGSTYPPLFERLRLNGPVTPQMFGRWFAEENHRPLAAVTAGMPPNVPGYPGVGGSIALSQLGKLAAEVDCLALALTQALKNARATSFPLIQQSIVEALQFDDNGDFQLEVPDAHVDLGTWSRALQKRFPANDPVTLAAAAVERRLRGVQVYGDKRVPDMRKTVLWDFSDALTAVSITVPDPLLQGVADWRTPYYMVGKVDPAKPPALKAQVPFLANRGPGQNTRAPWPEFLEQYHRGPDDKVVPVLRLLRLQPFFFPVFDPKFKPNPDAPPIGGQDPKGGGPAGAA